MEGRIREKLHQMLGDRVRFDCPMSECTTFRIGGNADALCRVDTLQDLQKVMAYLNERQISKLVVGKGSNLLVRDEGLEGVVLILQGDLARVGQDPDDEDRTRAGGGTSLSDLLVFCRRYGWGGLEFLAGIPGTVGGALVMNAGAFGGEIENHVDDVQLLTPAGRFMAVRRDELNFSYRRLELEEGSVIVFGHFRLEKSSTEDVSRRIAANLGQRVETQPMQYASAGSVFKNPPGDYAGRLIEGVGLKGTIIGKAKISERHANYIVNLGGATAKDVIALMDLARKKVRQATGVDLEPEIKVVGRSEW